MPYRLDISCPPSDALDLLVQLGALDVEQAGEGLAAILPDGVAPDTVARALEVADVTVSPAFGRDNGSVWVLSPRAVRIGSVVIAPTGVDTPPGALRLADSDAFGTGLHPTTALCIESIEEIVNVERPDCILDVGTGSGILALTALKIGVPRAVALDIDPDALTVAIENARLNGLADRMRVVHAGPEGVEGTWPLIVANVLAAPLIEMAPALVRRVGRHGRLILSGIAVSLEAEVRQAYVDLGMRYVGSTRRAGWTVLILQSSW